MGFLAEVKERQVYFRQVAISDSTYYTLIIEDWTGNIDSGFIQIPTFYWNSVMEPRGFVYYLQDITQRYRFSELPDLVKVMLCLYLDGAGTAEASITGASNNRSLTGYQLGDDEYTVLNSVIATFRIDVAELFRADADQYGKDAGVALARYDVKDAEFNGNPYRYMRSLHMALDYLIGKDDVLTDQEVEFVKNYGPYVTPEDQELLQLLNLRIISEQKESNFISETFGFEDAYTLLEFNDRVVQAIRDIIDDNDPAGFPIKTSHKLQWFENLAPLYAAAGLASGFDAGSAAVLSTFPVGLAAAYGLGLGGGWVYSLGSKEPLVFDDIAVGPIDDPEGNGDILPIEIKRRVGLQKAFPEDQDQYQTLFSTIYGIPEGYGVPINPDSPQYFAGTGPTGDVGVPTTDLQNSVFYERPTSFAEIVIYQEDFMTSFFQWTDTFTLFSNRGEWVEKFRSTQASDVLRPADIVFDFYVQFVSAIVEDIEEDGRLNELSVGDRFVGLAKRMRSLHTPRAGCLS
jgi:hypothetical protein